MKHLKTVKEKQNRDYNPEWNQTEINLVKTMYPTMKSCMLLERLPKRSWESIKHYAKKNNIKRIGSPDRRKANLSPLLLESENSYYWVGFIVADGYIVGDTYLGITVGNKDMLHLMQFTTFVGSSWRGIRTLKTGLHEFKVGHQYCVRELRKKFDLKPNKTYNPMDIKYLENMKDELFLSFVIGLIDGDGSICKQTGRNDCVISIGLHHSWYEFLCYVEDRVHNIFNIDMVRSSRLTKVSKRSTDFGETTIASLRFSNSKTVDNLYQFQESFELPVLNRKWGKICDTY